MLGALWGAVYPLTTVVLRDLPAPAVVVARTGLAAVLLMPIAWHRGLLESTRKRPGAILLAAVLQATLPLVLLTSGQEHVGAGLAGILLSSQPVWAALLLAALTRQVAWQRLCGVVLGLVGVALTFGDLDLGETSGLGGFSLLAAAVLFAAGAVYIERVIPDVPPLTIAAVAMTVSFVALLPFAAASSPAMPPTSTLAWLIVLGVVATGAALLLFYTLIRHIGSVDANLAGYLAPGFAVFYGAVFLDEPVTTAALAGLALVLLGSYVATRRQVPA